MQRLGDGGKLDRLDLVLVALDGGDDLWRAEPRTRGKIRLREAKLLAAAANILREMSLDVAARTTLFSAHGASLSTPDFTPIEQAFSKLKASLRRLGARTTEALWEAMGVAVEAITRANARAWFAHAGYALPAQPT